MSDLTLTEKEELASYKVSEKAIKKMTTIIAIITTVLGFFGFNLMNSINEQINKSTEKLAALENQMNDINKVKSKRESELEIIQNNIKSAQDISKSMVESLTLFVTSNQKANATLTEQSTILMTLNEKLVEKEAITSATLERVQGISKNVIGIKGTILETMDSYKNQIKTENESLRTNIKQDNEKQKEEVTKALKEMNDFINSESLTLVEGQSQSPRIAQRFVVKYVKDVDIEISKNSIETIKKHGYIIEIDEGKDMSKASKKQKNEYNAEKNKTLFENEPIYSKDSSYTFTVVHHYERMPLSGSETIKYVKLEIRKIKE